MRTESFAEVMEMLRHCDGAETAEVHRRFVTRLVCLASRQFEAVESYQRAMKVREELVAEQPKNEQFQQDIRGTRKRLAEALSFVGHPQALKVTMTKGVQRR